YGWELRCLPLQVAAFRRHGFTLLGRKTTLRGVFNFSWKINITHFSIVTILTLGMLFAILSSLIVLKIKIIKDLGDMIKECENNLIPIVFVTIVKQQKRIKSPNVLLLHFPFILK